ncbi:zinc finger protein ZAT11-like [Gastrolobium bilobum]|uniref:zinc finger protein ZAT11-like n=1 Tax=Gastrolobium bilobum TaxID=150636 RepID=UPI002AB1EF61|nr:zinc finger protein ZAT11-like [Gastrolobium bilobum]
MMMQFAQPEPMIFRFKFQEFLTTPPHKFYIFTFNFVAMIKRQRENEEKESIELANSLILLSHVQENKPLKKSYVPVEFECKTCNRKFSSFQALGGHRTSHKKPKLDAEEKAKSFGNKPKMHECSICGQEFSLGQALGGHMRRHRAAMNEGFSSINQVIAKAPVLKRSNSKRVMSLKLDLNLTPLENDLKLLFGNKAPQVDLSLF